MKIKIYALLCLITLLSCGREIVEYASIDKFNYKNETDSDIVIFSYQQGIKSRYELPKDKTYSQELENNFGSTDKIIFYADSVKVVYSNLKFKVWKATDDNSRNIIRRFDNYKKINKKDRYAEYQFIFTAADMNNTIPCNGNCN